MGPKKNPSSKEKYERQKELARLRKRRQLERMTDEQKEAKKKYDRERMAKLRAEKKVKRIGDMNEREKRRMRKYWRERHREQKKRKQTIENAISETPPNSPIADDVEAVQRRRGRKQVRKDRAKAYRTIKKQSEIIKELEKKVEKYKKRLHREKKKMEDVTSPSPRKQMRKIVGREKVSPHIKKQLFLGITLKKQLESQFKKVSKTKRNKQIVRKAIGKDVLKKYRVQKYFKKIIPPSKPMFENENTFEYQRNPKKSVRYKLSEKLVKFFEEDTVSRMCPGKKDFVTKGKIKKQRRVLLDTIENLYKRFMAENKVHISRSTFYRSRPFWVTFPKKSDHETCACIKHANMGFLVDALKNTKVITERTPREVLNAAVCSTKKEKCFMGQCKNCKNKSPNFHYDDDFVVKFCKWVTLKEKRNIKNKVRLVKKTVKITERKRVSQLIPHFKQELEAFKKHVFYAHHQSSSLKTSIENLAEGTLIFRMNFSENYVAKYSTEVQSVHFGASKKQISLNTGIRYAYVNEKSESMCFATVCDNLDHQSHAVWAHMRPIFNMSARDFPKTRNVVIFSDSPSSQYRNRNNMYLSKTMLPEYFPQLQTFPWNFTEAGHGKGPMDGVGGTLKRGADQTVLHGKDVTCAKEFVEATKSYNIVMYEIPVEDIQRMKSVVADFEIPPIKGIMKVHQITWSKGGPMYTRTLSCFECATECHHYHFSKLDDANSIESSQAVLPKNKLSVEEVFTSSEEEDPSYHDEPDKTGSENLMTVYAGNACGPVLANSLASGVHVIVEYEIKKGKKSETKQFMGVCQGSVKNDEVEVLFMKNCSKENTLFIVDDRDLASVPVTQIKAIVPTPALVLKGNRVFYKFRKVF